MMALVLLARGVCLCEFAFVCVRVLVLACPSPPAGHASRGGRRTWTRAQPLPTFLHLCRLSSTFADFPPPLPAFLHLCRLSSTFAGFPFAGFSTFHTIPAPSPLLHTPNVFV